MDSQVPDLGPKSKDLGPAMAKGIVGLLPLIGPLVSEAVGQIIPDHRLNRIEDFLRILEGRVERIEPNVLRNRFNNPDFLDLFEDGLYCVARAVTREKKEHVASVLANGLSEDELAYARRKRLLSLLAQLTDAEIIVLDSYSIELGRNQEFLDRHREVLLPTPAHMGSSREEIDKDTLQRSQKTHLVQLDLLRPSFSKPRRGEYPEFDEKTGMMKATGYRLSSLGSLLLREIGMIEEF